MTPEQLQKAKELQEGISLATQLANSKLADREFLAFVLLKSPPPVWQGRAWLKDRLRLARLQLQKDIEADLKDMQAQLDAL